MKNAANLQQENDSLRDELAQKDIELLGKNESLQAHRRYIIPPEPSELDGQGG